LRTGFRVSREGAHQRKDAPMIPIREEKMCQGAKEKQQRP